MAPGHGTLSPRTSTGSAAALGVRWRRLAAGGPAWPWFGLAAAAVLLAHVAVAARLGAAVATIGEARLAAAATGTARFVADPIPFADGFAARQLAVVATVLPVPDLPAIDVARLGCLVLGAVAALLTWPVVRGLGAPPPAAAVTVVLAGASTLALFLHTGVAAAAPAVLWLMLAATAAARLRRPEPALVLAGVAVVTAPLLGAALIALAAHLVLDRTVRTPEPARIPLGMVLGALAAAAAVVVMDPVVGPTIGVGGPVVATSVALGFAMGGGLVLLAARRVAGWLRALLTPPALLLLVVVLPGPARATAAILVLPVVAVLAGVLVGWATDPGRGTRWAPRPGPAAVLTIAVLVGLSAAAVLPRPTGGSGDGLAGWATAELPPDTVLRADALDRVALLSAGFPADRLRAPTDPPTPGEAQLLTRRPANGLPADPLDCPGPLASIPRGTGGAESVLCGGGPAAAEPDGTAAGLADALVGNPSLRFAPAAEQALSAGEVDGRVTTVLAAISTSRELVVADFPAVALDVPGTPRRQVLITSVDGTDAGSSELLATWLGGQQPPFAPARVQPSGRAALVVWFASAPPDTAPE